MSWFRPYRTTELQEAWLQGFAAGVSKQWDFLAPLMTENIDAFKKHAKEEAAKEAIKRLNQEKHASKPK